MSGEADLFRGTGVRVEPCICGTDVIQHRRELVQDVVMRHNATPAHQTYRLAAEGGPTTGTGSVDMSGAPHGASGRPSLGEP